MRPKTIKYNTGEITFKNIPIEEREEVIKKILGPKMVPEFDEEKEEYILIPEVTDIIRGEPVIKNLPDKGLSFVRIGNMWSVVELKFNIETKEAEVSNIISLHTNRNIAIDKFRVKFFKEI